LRWPPFTGGCSEIISGTYVDSGRVAVGDIVHPELSKITVDNGMLLITVKYSDKGVHTWACKLSVESERLLRKKLSDG